MRISGISAIAAAIALAGCTRTDTHDASTPHDTGTSGAGAPAAASGQPAAPMAGRGVSVDVGRQALETATRAVPDSRAFDLETETDNGQRVLDVKVAADGSEHKVVVGADGTQVVWQQQASTPSDDIAKVSAAKIDAAAALQAAAETERGSTLSEMEIDTNRAGVIVWQVTLFRADGATREVDVDAQTGDVTSR